MNEPNWLACEEPNSLLEFIRNKVSNRKLLHFACNCERRVLTKADDRTRRAVGVTEQFTDNLVGRDDLISAWTAAGLDGTLVARAADQPWDTARVTASQMARSLGGDDLFSSATLAERRQQAALLRHIIGNPFRPYLAPKHWPAAVVQLAETLYNGTDCAFALHDALLEAGHAELAEHFAKEQWHPKGCWVVDLILGKQ